jgi:hypothetical protein
MATPGSPIATPPGSPIVTPAAASPLPTPGAIFLSPLGESPLPNPTPTPTIAVIESQATSVVPNSLTLEQAVLLKPATGGALVAGRLINNATNKPAPMAWLYLAGVIGPDNNPQVWLDISKAPLSISNQDGVFYFQNVKPGKYAVIVWSPITTVMIDEPGSPYTLLFRLAADEVKNLHDLPALIP